MNILNPRIMRWTRHDRIEVSITKEIRTNQVHYHTPGDFYWEEIRTLLVKRIPKDNYYLRCD